MFGRLPVILIRKNRLHLHQNIAGSGINFKPNDMNMLKKSVTIKWNGVKFDAPQK